jgi:hypothetical protein
VLTEGKIFECFVQHPGSQEAVRDVAWHCIKPRTPSPPDSILLRKCKQEASYQVQGALRKRTTPRELELKGLNAPAESGVTFPTPL